MMSICFPDFKLLSFRLVPNTCFGLQSMITRNMLDGGNAVISTQRSLHTQLYDPVLLIHVASLVLRQI